MGAFDLLELADDDIAADSKTDWVNGNHKQLSPLIEERIVMGDMDINVHGNRVPIEIDKQDALSETEESYSLPDISDTNIHQHFELLDDIFGASGKKSIIEMSADVVDQAVGVTAAAGGLFMALKTKNSPG